MGVILNRSSLTQSQQNEHARKQFDPLPEELQEWYEDTCKTIFKAYTDDHTISELNQRLERDFLVKDSFTLRWEDMAAVCYFATEPSYEIPSLSSAVSNNYIRLVCEYVNHVRRVARNQKIAEEAAAANPKRSPPPTDHRPSCIMIPDDTFNQIQEASAWGLGSRSKAITNILKARNLAGPTFMNLDYLFNPYLDSGTHYVLMVIAPKKHFIFVIDSINGQWPVEDYPVQSLYAMLLQLLPGSSEDDKEKQAKEHWNVFGQWSRRTTKKDGSPNCAQQKDRYNCVIFTITNAFCLAFGFDLLCYRPEDLNFGKRPRVAAELNNDGFTGDFAYDMFDLPSGPADRVGLPQPAAAEEEGRQD